MAITGPRKVRSYTSQGPVLISRYTITTCGKTSTHTFVATTKMCICKNITLSVYDANIYCSAYKNI